MIKLSFCQNDSSMAVSFCLKDSLITHTLFELQPIMIFSLVANFGDQSLLAIKIRADCCNRKGDFFVQAAKMLGQI